MKLGKLYGVGIGPGDPQYLTFRAADVLRSVDIIFTVISRNVTDSISKQVVESLKPSAPISMLTFSMSRDYDEREAQITANAEIVMETMAAGKNCAFATLGDPMTYSTFGYVLKKVMKKYPEADVEIVPGITSFATFAAKAKTILVENRETLRIIPSFKNNDVDTLEFPKNSTTILLKTYRTRKALLEILNKEKEKGELREVIYGEELSMPAERIVRSLDEMAEIPETYFSMIMVKK